MKLRRLRKPNGQTWSSTFVIALGGAVAVRSGRFSIQGRAPNKVRFDIRGRLRNGAISGRVRLTLLDIDYVGPSDDSCLCDTGAGPYRARATAMIGTLARRAGGQRAVMTGDLRSGGRRLLFPLARPHALQP